MKRQQKAGWFREAIRYTLETRTFIYAIIALFVCSAIAGFFLAEYLGFFDEMLKKLIDKTTDLSTVELIVFIFLNNLQSAFFGMLLGILVGIPPVFNAALNGAVLGYVLRKVHAVTGFADFWRLLPHGIFELPAIFIALGLGVRLGSFPFGSNLRERLKYLFIGSLKAFICIVLPLLLIAAIIEGLLIGLTS
ncbi:stage II sporulation protein M [Candidatus Pacearchaeota archaeon]|nr:stage II sporulation protein M [Candidatus Pacearchaeota archaeon]